MRIQMGLSSKMSACPTWPLMLKTLLVVVSLSMVKVIMLRRAAAVSSISTAHSIKIWTAKCVHSTCHTRLCMFLIGSKLI